MTHGPGKYDDLATHVRQEAGARGVVVIVIDGNKGAGFSVQGEADVIVRLPSLLRRLADDIAHDIKERGKS